MQGGDGRGQLDGREEAPPAAGEHRQHPVITGDGEDIAEEEKTSEQICDEIL